jgi:phage terminase large subunit-like protein
LARELTRGEKVCQFIEKFCPVPEGKLVGQPIKLMPFQRKFILDIYDNPKGTSRAQLSVGRKNGKSALIAAILLAHIVGPEARQNSQIISGARSREQASLVFKLAEKMVRLSLRLTQLVKVIPSQKSLIGLPMNVEYRAISAEAGTAHGLSPVLAILDEVGQVRGPTDAFIEAIETSQGAHDDPLLIAISTQAATDGDLFSIWLDDAKNAKDPRIVSHVYTAPEDCDVMDRKAWKAANPALGKFRALKDLQDFAKQADRLPAKENSFRWLYLNQRIEATSPFLNRGEWEANKGAALIEGGMTCFAGLDLSSSRDLTAFVMVFPVGDEYHVLPQFFMPGDGIRDRAQEDKVPYDVWAKQGFITLIDGPVIVPAVVAQHVAEASSDFDMQLMAYDRWRINDFTRELDAIGVQLPMQAFGQGYKDMAPAVDKLEQLVLGHKLRHGNNPVMNMCAANAIAERDPAGNRKLNKAKSVGRIDGLVALAMALGVEAMGEGAAASSPWDDPAFTITA